MANTLLALPRELRDQIFDYVIQDPKVTAAVEHDAATEKRDINKESINFARGEIIQTKPERKIYVLSSSLLRINKQICQEVKERPRSLQRVLAYYLDVTIVNEQNILPCWIRVPARIDTIPIVIVRLHGCGSRPRSIVSGFADNGYGSPIVWALHSLLYHLSTAARNLDSSTGLEKYVIGREREDTLSRNSISRYSALSSTKNLQLQGQLGSATPPSSCCPCCFCGDNRHFSPRGFRYAA